jgi:lysophospholipase L1-like esterase
MARLKNLTVSLISLVFVFVILEIVFQTISPKSPPGTTYGKRINLNSYGLRSPEAIIPKPKQTFRIVVLGDSFAWGVGLDLDETLPFLVERHLRSKYSNVEVVNAAIPADNTVRQLNRFNHIGLKHEPNLLLLIYNINDIAFIPQLATNNYDKNKVVPVFQIENGPNWEIYSEKHGIRGFIYWFEQRSKFMEFLVPRMGALLRQMGLLNSVEFSWVQKTLEGFQDNNPGWVESKRALKELHDICSRENIPFIVAIYPMLVDGADRVKEREVHKVIVGYLDELKIPALDLLPVFDGKIARQYWINYMDGHPSKEAHELVAKELTPFIEAAIARDLSHR